MKRVTGIVIVILSLVFTMSACADEILEEMNYAKEAYKDKNYSEAVESLKFAITKIQSLQADELRKALPKPLSGWTMEEQESEAATLGLFGLSSGLGVTRKYYKKDSNETIEISIIAQSAILQQIMIFLKNPALVTAQPNTKLEKRKISGKGIKIIEEFSSKDKEGKLSLTPDEQTLIIVEGQEISDKAILYNYLEKIDFQLIAEIL